MFIKFGNLGLAEGWPALSPGRGGAERGRQRALLARLGRERPLDQQAARFDAGSAGNARPGGASRGQRRGRGASDARRTSIPFGSESGSERRRPWVDSSLSDLVQKRWFLHEVGKGPGSANNGRSSRLPGRPVSDQKAAVRGSRRGR